MATPYAFVTLVTSDSYLPGALALVAALNELHLTPPVPPEVDFQTVCLVSPETVDVSSIKLLRRAFNVVVGVEIIEQEDDKNLRLLGRPDLNTVLTKLHLFRLTQYSKIIFLDADVLPIRPLSHLFTLPQEFSAVPDVGWPDIFNSGVMVVSPGEDKFNELMELQKTRGSWDGGDQGLLNEWRGQNWHRLSFVYNTTPTAAYTYAPAYERFGSGITAVHFIGENKPWKSLTWRAPGTKSAPASLDNGEKRVYNYEALVDRWYDVYDRHYRSEILAAPRDEFEVQRYTSVWDEGTSIGSETQSGGTNFPVHGGVMGLDELRTVAIEGLGALESKPSSRFQSTDGDYRSLPLEGRIDLMRPVTESAHEPGATEGDDTTSGHGGGYGSPGTPRPTHVQMPPEDQGYFRMDTYPTPGPHEVPGAPYLHGRSLPPTQTPTPYYGPSSQQQYSASTQEGHPGGHGTYEPQYHGLQQPQPQSYQPHTSPTLVERGFAEHERYGTAGSDTPRAAPRIPGYQQYSQEGGQQLYGGDHQYNQGGGQQLYGGDHQYSQGGGQQSHGGNQQYSQGGGQQSYGGDHQYSQRGGQQSYGGNQQDGYRERRDQYSPTHQERHREQHGGHGDSRPQHQDRAGIQSARSQPPTQHRQTEYHRSGSHEAARQYAATGHEHWRRASGPPTLQGQRESSQGQWHEESRQQHHHDHRRAHSEGHHHHHHHQHQQEAPPPPPPRPASPPKLEWNPAVEPPPKTPPSVSFFPEETYFPNVWDQTPSKQHDAAFQTYPSQSRTEHTDVFFHPPPPAAIPEQLIREGQYANVLGHPPPQHSPESVAASPTPDRSNVHAVFPWEEKPRHRPRRVFPRTDAPPPVANYIESEPTSSPIATPPPVERTHPPQVQSPNSPVGLGWSGGFSNAWDSVPSIQKYASKLVGSPKIYQMMHPPAVTEDDWRKWEKQRERDWQERQDASSMDGDDEDDYEEEVEGRLSESSAKSKASGSSRMKSRALSSRSKKSYRTRGIQASPETSEEGVQCTVIEEGPTATPEHVSVEVATDPHPTTGPCPYCGRSCRPEECPAARARARSGSVRGFGTRRWPGETILLPSLVPRDTRPDVEQMVGTPLATVNVRSGVPFPSMASPTGLRSPATLGSPRTYSPPKVISPPPMVSPPPAVSSPKVSSPKQTTSPVRVQSPLHEPRQATSSPISTPQPVSSVRPSSSPKQVNSPRRLSSTSMQTVPRTTSPVITTAARPQQQTTSTPSPKLTRLASLSTPESPQIQRTISADTAATTPSPSTTYDSLITPENTPVQARRAARVWDPARGVDVFKRGSEEVLARFLRMGSFDEEGKRQTA